MAFKHRKLFPAQTGENQTMDCPIFCDPSCPYKYNCFPIPGQNLIYPPPSQPNNYSHKDHPISPFVIIIITLLSSLFLLICYYAIIVKHCCDDCTRSASPPSPSDGTGDEEQHLDENQGPAVHHPIWFITTVGLQQAIINSITVCKYKKDEGLIEGTDCSVCLSEFREDETLRLLPKCNHAFHTHCIDTWLRSHTNCPLCRARIVSDTVISNSASTERNSQNLSANEETQMGSSYQGDSELNENLGRSSLFVENRAETEGVCELQQVDEDDNIRSKEGVNSHNENNGVSQVLINSVVNHQHMDHDEEIQSFRRSISMDSSFTSSICLGMDKFHSEGCSGNSKLDVKEFDSHVKGQRIDSTGETLQDSPVSVKRSLSSSGGKSFWPRQNRCPNSILPL